MGDTVERIWGDGTATGGIIRLYTRKTAVTIKDTIVTRDAFEDEPAFLIERNDGDHVLKSATELNAA